jgi:hypothetical protein
MQSHIARIATSAVLVLLSSGTASRSGADDDAHGTWRHRSACRGAGGSLTPPCSAARVPLIVINSPRGQAGRGRRITDRPADQDMLLGTLEQPRDLECLGSPCAMKHHGRLTELCKDGTAAAKWQQSVAALPAVLGGGSIEPRSRARRRSWTARLDHPADP